MPLIIMTYHHTTNSRNYQLDYLSPSLSLSNLQKTQYATNNIWESHFRHMLYFQRTKYKATIEVASAAIALLTEQGKRGKGKGERGWLSRNAPVLSHANRFVAE